MLIEPDISYANDTTSRQLTVEKHRYLKKLYADEITSDSNVLVTFPRALVADEGDRERLSLIARGAFTIKPRESYSERISKYLGELKDQAVLALRDRRTSTLESLLDAYVSVAETFLTEMQRAGGGYSFEQAQKEEAAVITGGWDEVKWISAHLAEIHNIGCRTGDMKIASLVIAPPIRIAFAAIRARDHFLFREFTRFSYRVYDAALADKDPKMRRYLVDRAWRHLRELGNVGVQLQLERTANDAQSFETLSDFGTVLLLRYQDLLRAAFQSMQVADFRLIKQGAIGLFQHMSSPISASPESLEARLSKSDLSTGDQRQIREQLKRRQLPEEANQRFLLRRSQMFFGIGAHIFKARIVDPKNTVVSEFLNEVIGLVPSAPAELSELYLSLSDLKVQSIWGWEEWDVPEEGPWVGNPFEKMTQYYCFQLTRMCQRLSRDQVTALSFPKSDAFVNDISEHGAITTTLKSFSSDHDEWRDVIPDSWIPGIEALGFVFERVGKEKAREDEDRLIAAELNCDLLDKFRTSFKRAFVAKAGIRRVFVDQNAYTDESYALPKRKNELKCGLNRMEDKRLYVETDLDPDRGHRHGEDLGLSESQLALDQMLELLPECEAKSGETTETTISRAIVELRNAGHVASVIFTDLAGPRQMSLENSSSFTAAWRLDAALRKNPAFSGLFHFGDSEIPVFAVWRTSERTRGAVIALGDCMQWVQKSPIDDESEIGLVDGPFSIRFADLGKEDELRSPVEAARLAAGTREPGPVPPHTRLATDF